MGLAPLDIWMVRGSDNDDDDDGDRHASSYLAACVGQRANGLKWRQERKCHYAPSTIAGPSTSPHLCHYLAKLFLSRHHRSLVRLVGGIFIKSSNSSSSPPVQFYHIIASSLSLGKLFNKHLAQRPANSPPSSSCSSFQKFNRRFEHQSAARPNTPLKIPIAKL